MAGNNSLTPQRRAKLKQEVLAEIGTVEVKRPSALSAPKKPVARNIPQMPKTEPVKKIMADIKKTEVKTEFKKMIAETSKMPEKSKGVINPVIEKVIEKPKAIAESVAKVIRKQKPRPKPKKRAVHRHGIRKVVVKRPEAAKTKSISPKDLLAKEFLVERSAILRKKFEAIKPMAKPVILKTAPVPIVNLSSQTLRRGAEKSGHPSLKLRRGEEIKLLPKPTLIEKVSAKMQNVQTRKSAKSAKSWKMFLLGIIIFVILAAAIFLGVSAIGIYKFGWTDKTSRAIVNYVPLPVGSVNGQMIRLSDYYRDLETLKIIKLSIQPEAKLNPAELGQQTFDRLISLKIIDSELKKYGKSISAEQLNQEMADFAAQAGSEEKLAEQVRKDYGMSVTDFKNRVLYPVVAINILQEAILNDESLAITKQAKKNAADALNLAIKPAVDFETLVYQYSNDSSIINSGGDMGWINRGELPTDLENKLFVLSSGQVYNEVVKDSSGYHVFKVDSKLKNDETGAESIKLRRISIRPDVNFYIKGLLDQAIIKKYIK